MKITTYVLLVLLSCFCIAANAAKQNNIQIALTFDDLPWHNDLPPGVTRQQVAKDIIAALKAAHAPKVYGFVNAVHLQNDPTLAEVLVDWRAAGFPLGNHTWSHANLNNLSVEAYVDEIIKNEVVLKQYSKGMDWHWFRYPYLVEGSDIEKRNAIRKVLAQRGYHIAAVTMSFGDYMWNGPYARCATQHDDEAIKLMEKNYLLAAAQALESSHLMSNALYNRDIPYVLLMHIGGFDAHMLPQLLALYKSKGVQFITLEQAEKAMPYRSDFNPALSAEPSGLEARMRARGLQVPDNDPHLTSMLDRICK